MGKRTRWREAHRREADQCVSAVLEEHSRLDARPRAPAAFRDFGFEYCQKVTGLSSYALRTPEDWRCRIKSRSKERRFLDLVRFVFERYRVAPHLEQVWIDDVEDDFSDRIALPEWQAVRRPEVPNLRAWYVVAAQGGSLYKQEAHPYLSRQETHHFLTARTEVTSTKQAFWYGVARAMTERADVALKVARSKVANYSIASTYWKDVARFFARNPLPIHEMDDLADFLLAAKQEDQDFSLKGRTLVSLTRRMQDWHRTLQRSHANSGESWAGILLSDIEYGIGKDDKYAIWRFRQIKTGGELYREGHRMHHCVATYTSACMRGDISIWSLTSEFPIGRINRGVTMEVTKDGRIVQCRGFGNRLPYGNEVIMVKRWAGERGLRWVAPER